MIFFQLLQFSVLILLVNFVYSFPTSVDKDSEAIDIPLVVGDDLVTFPHVLRCFWNDVMKLYSIYTVKHFEFKFILSFETLVLNGKTIRLQTSEGIVDVTILIFLFFKLDVFFSHNCLCKNIFRSLKL